eukprot:4581166-Prymnesium_polylepis.1
MAYCAPCGGSGRYARPAVPPPPEGPLEFELPQVTRTTTSLPYVTLFNPRGCEIIISRWGVPFQSDVPREFEPQSK